MKKILGALLSMLLVLPLTAHATTKINNSDLDPTHYHASWHSQSTYLNLSPEEITTVWVKFKNTGTATWYNSGDHPIRLGTSHALDRTSNFYKHTWISANRTTNLKETEVKPGGYGTFEFYLKAPNENGVYQEYFQPVADGITWMEDWGVFWKIEVTGASQNTAEDNLQYDNQDGYHASFYSQSDENITLNPGEYQSVWVKFLNTGSQTWYNNGNYPINLGTDSPQDHNSIFYKHTWLSTNRSARLVESSVFPGQTGTFEFYLLAPSEPGEYYEYFTPVAENLTWIGQNGVYWIINITGDSNSDNSDNNTPGSFTLEGNIDHGQVNLNWDEYVVSTQTTSNTGISGYKVVRSEFNANPTYPDDWWVYLSDQHSQSYTDTSVLPGHSYYYRIGAYVSGLGVIAYSNNIYLSIPTDSSTSPDNDDNSFSLTAKSQSNGIHLDWNQYIATLTTSNSVDGYKVVRSTTTSSPAHPDDTINYISGSTTTDYIDTTVTNNQAYYYRIGAYKNGVIVAYSNFVHVIFTGDLDTNDNQFELRATSNNSGIQLNWDKYPSSDISGYKILRSISNSSPSYPDQYFKYIAGQTNTSYLDQAVDTGQDYYYRVGIYQDGEVVEYSNPVHIEFTGTN